MIDAGGNVDSGDAIYEALNYYCTDNVIEYVILSHGDDDHIVNFYSYKTGFGKWLNENNNSCNLLIDFDILTDKTITIGV